MRLGKISVNFEYIVDLDDEEMVDHAKEAIYEDISNTLKYETTGDPYGSLHYDIKAGNYNEGDIAEFLLDSNEG